MHRQEDAYVPALVDILRWFASEANNKMARAALRRELSVARHFACITRTAAHLLIISWLQFVLSSSKQKKMRHCESSIHPCRETSCEVAAVAHCWQAIFNYEYDFSDNNELSTINHSVICLRAGGDEDEDKEWWTEKCHKVLPLTFEKKTASLLLPTSTWAPFWKKTFKHSGCDRHGHTNVNQYSLLRRKCFTEKWLKWKGHHERHPSSSA